MYRSINDMTGFADRYDNNRMIMSIDDYPEQATEYLGKYITLRYYDRPDQTIVSRFAIPYHMRQRHPECQKNSEFQKYFRVVRYDLTEPYKVILVSENSDVVITDNNYMESLYDLDGSVFYIRALKYCERKGYEYLQMNTPLTSEDEFFEHYINEPVLYSSVKNDDLFGREVYISFEKDMLNGVGTDIKNTKETFELTDEMVERIRRTHKNEAVSRLDKDKYIHNFKSYPYYHNIHEESYTDNAYKSTCTGTIIRADTDYECRQIVVMTLTSTTPRYICIDEAKFVFDTSEEPNRDLDVYDLVCRDYRR